MYENFSQNASIKQIKDKIAWKFWDIHIGEEDIHHQKIVRDAINNILVTHPLLKDELIEGYLYSVDAWDNFWVRSFSAAQVAVTV